MKLRLLQEIVVSDKDSTICDNTCKWFQHWKSLKSWGCTMFPDWLTPQGEAPRRAPECIEGSKTVEAAEGLVFAVGDVDEVDASDHPVAVVKCDEENARIFASMFGHKVCVTRKV